MAARTDFDKGTATIRVEVPKHLLGKQADKAKRDGVAKGLTTGLGTCGFAEALLLANATAHKPDDVLAATFAKEFPKRDVIQAISTWRSYFNGSRHGLNAAKKHSDRYDAAGNVATRKASNGKPASKGKGKGAKGKGKQPAKGRKGKGAAQPAPQPAE